MRCDWCNDESKDAYRVEDEMVCESCYQDAVSRAEYAYESAREEGRL